MAACKSREGDADREVEIVLPGWDLSEGYQLRMELSSERAEVILCERGEDCVIGCGTFSGRKPVIFLEVKDLAATLGIRDAAGECILAEDVDIRGLSTEVAGGVGLHGGNVCRGGNLRSWSDGERGMFFMVFL